MTDRARLTAGLLALCLPLLVLGVLARQDPRVGSGDEPPALTVESFRLAKKSADLRVLTGQVGADLPGCRSAACAETALEPLAGWINETGELLYQLADNPTITGACRRSTLQAGSALATSGVTVISVPEQITREETERMTVRAQRFMASAEKQLSLVAASCAQPTPA